MESIRSLFLNYFAPLRIPLTLPAICRIKSLAIWLFVQQPIHADIKRPYYWLSVREERLNWILLTHLLIWRILCAVLERYFCNKIPLQITRRPFCYSVSDRYRAFISANPMWKCSFDIVLISPNRSASQVLFFVPKCYVTPVIQHWCCKNWKHCYIDGDLTLFCYLVHGIPLMK